MKILFWGETEGNVGPANINRGIAADLSERFRRVTSRGKYRELAAALCLLLPSDAVVVSGLSRKGVILVGAAKLLGKRSVYLMHGCAEQEYRCNGVEPDARCLAQEAFLLKHCDLILPVSRRYMLWFREQYPRFANKTDYLCNGVDTRLFARQQSRDKIPGSVAVAGGLTPLKNNLVVARAVEDLEGKACLRIYGGEKQPLPGIYRYTEQVGKLANGEFLEQLSATRLFVLNSLLESFSIAAVEALACGCSLLISEKAGVADLLALEETDVIHDPMDVEEIRSKIGYLLEHPNHHRLRSQFDPEAWSFKVMAENLENKCAALVCSR